MKKKILFFIPFGIVSIILFYSWFIFIMTDNIVVFANYLGLFFFIPIAYFLSNNKTFKKATVLFGIYLVLATINLFSFLPYVMTSSFGISLGSFKIWTPQLNGFALIILILYGILNFDTLTDIYLDYKEAKGKL